MSRSGGNDRTTMHHDNAAIPELLGVFRKAQLYHINSERHALFNSWLIAGIMHRSNPNAYAILDHCPDTAHTIRYCLQLLEREASGQQAHRRLGIDQRKQLIEDQKDIIDHIYSRTDFDTPLALRSLTRAASIFNRPDTVTQSVKALADGQAEKRKRFVHGFSPFVTLHTTAHLMDIIGQQLQDRGGNDSKVSRFKNFLLNTRHESIPLEGHSHDVPENVTLRAVKLLRDINAFLSYVQKNDFLPANMDAEKTLVTALLIHTHGYRATAPVRHSTKLGTQDNVVALQPG